MKSSKIKIIKGDFRKKFKNQEVEGEIKLDNGRKLQLNMDNTKGIIEITASPKVDNKLSEEERIAIIERVLIEYAAFLSSVFNASIYLNMETYSLTDNTTSEKIETTKTILEEFVESKYSKNTKNRMLQAVVSLHEQIENNSEEIGKKTVEMEIPKMFFVNKMDATYFSTNFLKKYSKVVEVRTKGNKLVIKPL